MMDEWSKAAMRDNRIEKFERAKQRLFNSFFNILNEIDGHEIDDNEAYGRGLQTAGETLKLLDEIIVFEEKGDWR